MRIIVGMVVVGRMVFTAHEKRSPNELMKTLKLYHEILQFEPNY